MLVGQGEVVSTLIRQVIETYACSGILKYDRRNAIATTSGLHVYQCGTEMEDLIFDE